MEIKFKTKRLPIEEAYINNGGHLVIGVSFREKENIDSLIEEGAIKPTPTTLKSGYYPIGHFEVAENNFKLYTSAQ